MDKSNVKGMVIYSDGSVYKGNPGPYGCGIHYYTYNASKPNTKYPINTLHLSSKGYISGKGIELKEFPEIKDVSDFVSKVLGADEFAVNVIDIKEKAVGGDTIGTNNQGELIGLYHALESILDERPDVAIIYLDSEYAIKGIQFLDRWKKANWLTKQGTTVANKDIWLKIDELKNKLVKEVIPFTIRWINGHNDYKGDKKSTSGLSSNIMADSLASIGAALGHLKTRKVDLPDVYENTLDFEQIKKYNNPKPQDKIHPFLINSNLYNGYPEEHLGERNNHDKYWRRPRNVYYVGNPGTLPTTDKKKDILPEIFIGKNISDVQVGIVTLNKHDEVIETIEDVQAAWLNNHYKHNDYLYCMSLNTISTSKNYQYLKQYGTAGISASPNVPNLYIPKGESLTYVFDPVFLSMRNIDNIAYLNRIQHSIQTDSSKFKVIDITSLFYDTKEVTLDKPVDTLHKRGKQLVGKSLKPEIQTSTRYVPVDVTLGDDVFSSIGHEPVKRTLRITLGIDTIGRNQLKQIDTDNPTVHLVIWHHSGIMYKYATYIVTHSNLSDESTKDNLMYIPTDIGIWTSPFSSQILA